MVYTVRERCGKQLAHEASVGADLVSTVPESATPAALGYAKEVSEANTKEMFALYFKMVSVTSIRRLRP